MQNYMVLPDSKVLPLLGASSFSTGDGLDVTQRYGYDYSETPQSLVYRKRNTALTATIQMVYTNRMCVESGYLNILEYTDSIHNSVGDFVNLYWHGKQVGGFILLSAQFSSIVDHLIIFPEMSVSLSLTEGFVRHENLSTEVSTMIRPQLSK